ncbi:hypothetical protein A2W14_03025 [Candidatus Gottesmanbacteria bacterium RBG_16_37_8]|uniref:N-acetyltransferase domain-containing protein n=1 Tax=Candidatus Gottesmanbacteria bacterium RBG_16_37_8 TaxID=1798371 RepID=A0A1F5YUH2_9BACT|nr:MAG: hypothetical protein A2W14_03025 [Candidatus Gottesmanbacteria bacterium RBG_16_37_8]
MVIKNRFNAQDFDRISRQIYIAIQNERKLTKRPLEYIKKNLKKGNIYLALDRDDQVIGFIIREKIISNYYEIKSWYISPQNRHSGIGSKLMKLATTVNSFKYLSVTFQSEMIYILKHFGFKRIPLISLPINVLIKYIITRNWVSILTHIFIKKSYLLLKS